MQPFDRDPIETALTAFVANVVGDGIVDAELPVGSRPIRLGDAPDTLLVLYGSPDVGATVALAAADELDAERVIVAVLGDAHAIDDLQESVDQRPLAIAHLAGLVDDRVAARLLDLDAGARPHADLQLADGSPITTALADRTGGAA